MVNAKQCQAEEDYIQPSHLRAAEEYQTVPDRGGFQPTVSSSSQLSHLRAVEAGFQE